MLCKKIQEQQKSILLQYNIYPMCHDLTSWQSAIIFYNQEIKLYVLILKQNELSVEYLTSLGTLQTTIASINLNVYEH